MLKINFETLSLCVKFIAYTVFNTFNFTETTKLSYEIFTHFDVHIYLHSSKCGV